MAKRKRFERMTEEISVTAQVEEVEPLVQEIKITESEDLPLPARASEPRRSYEESPKIRTNTVLYMHPRRTHTVVRTIGDDGNQQDYYIRRLSSSVFEIERWGDKEQQRYTVFDNGKHRECGCQGFTKYRRCKHLDMVRSIYV